MKSKTTIQANRLGELIRGRRIELALKGSDIAKAVGVSRAYLSILETGRNPKTGKPSRPSPDVINGLASVLLLDPQGLTDAAGYPVASSPGPPWHAAQENALRRIKEKIHDLQKEAARIVLPSTPREGKNIPSGIAGFSVRPGDHILLLSESDSAHDVGLAVDFATGGLNRGEGGILRLPKAVSAPKLRQRIQREYGRASLERLALVPWSQGVLPHYKTGWFSRRETIRAHTEDLRRISEGGRPLIRFATPDTSDYFAWVRNPADVLEYEKIWPSDVGRIDPQRQFVFLCLYRMKDLEHRATADLTAAGMVLRLLESHNRVVYVRPGGGLLFDRDAARALIAGMKLTEQNPRMWQTLGVVGEKYGIWGEDHLSKRRSHEN